MEVAMGAGDLEPQTPVVVKASQNTDTVSSTTKIPMRTITVEGDGAVLQGLCTS